MSKVLPLEFLIATPWTKSDPSPIFSSFTTPPPSFLGGMVPVVGGVVVEVVGCEVPDPAVVAAVVLAEVGAVVAAAPLSGVRSRRSLRASAPPAGCIRPTDSMAAVRPQEVKSSREICPTARPTQQAAVNIPARRFPAFL